MATRSDACTAEGCRPAMGFESTGMPGLRKAAILMVAVGDELAKLFLQSLSNARRAAGDG